MPDNETRSIPVSSENLHEGVSPLAYSAQRWDEHMREHELVSAWTAKELSAALLAAQAVQGSVKEQLDTYKVAHAREHELLADKGKMERDLIAQAVQVAKDSTDVRLAGVNEFREQLSDQALTFVRVDVVEAKFNALGARLDALDNSWTSRMDGIDKAWNARLSDLDRTWNAKLDGINTAAIERLATLEKFMNSSQGRSGGSAATIAYIISAISVAAVIITLILKIVGP